MLGNRGRMQATRRELSG